MKTKILFVVALLVVTGGAFFGGLKYGQTPKALAKLSPGTIQAAFASRGTNGGNGTLTFTRGGGRSGGNPGGFANGKIIAADDKSITIQLQMGGPNGNSSGTKIVLLSRSSQILKSSAGTAEDLVVGQDVTVAGASNSDGSITAQTIQIRPPQAQQTQ